MFGMLAAVNCTCDLWNVTCVLNLPERETIMDCVPLRTVSLQTRRYRIKKQ